MFAEENGKVFLGLIELTEAKKLKEKLLTRHLDIELIHNDETCKKGCVVKVEAWADAEFIPQILEIIKEENLKQLETEGLDIDHDQLNQVFDTEAETAVCPACGTSFSTKLKECPECGLVFFNE